MIGSFQKFKKIGEFLTVFKIPKILLVYNIGLMLLSAVGQAVSISLFIPFLNSLQNNNSGEDSSRIISFLTHVFADLPADQHYFYMLLSILVIVCVVYLLMIAINVMILDFCIYRMQYQVCHKLIRGLLNARLKFFFQKKSGALINNLTTDINRASTCMTYLLRMTSQLLIVATYIVTSFIIVPLYTLVLIGVGGVLMVIFKKISPYLYKIGIHNRESEVEAKNMTVETLQGIRSVILSNAQDSHFKKFGEIIKVYYNSAFRYLAVVQNVPYFVNVVAVFVVGTILFLNKSYIVDSNPETFSKILFLIVISGLIFKTLGHANALHNSYAFNYPGIPVLLQLYDEIREYDAKLTENRLSVKTFDQHIAANNLSFEYLHETPILRSVNFEIHKDQKVAFVGSSGSGKSTVIDVISGFHDDYEGSIQVDGKELRDLNKGEWRGLIGYVSQESFLFNDSVRNNLLFGFDQEISDEELMRACRCAQLEEAILGFKEGLDTELGERGIRLSGGEKQRLAIARIFIHNPSIVLLDEATSSLDSAAEQKVKDALNELGKGRTVIAVAHRLSTIVDFDMIYVLEDGRIVESGSHTELLAREGKYYSLYTIQNKENAFA